MVGQAVTFAVAVSPASATGSVEFRDYGTSTTAYTTLAAVPLNNGTAAFTTAALTAGVHNIATSYAGDANTVGFTSALLAETVTQLASTVTLSSSENPTLPGHAVTITAVVAASGNFSTPASGTVQLMDGAAAVGTATLQNGSAQFSVQYSSAGSHSLTASYGGDANYLGSASMALTETVNPIATTTTAGSSANPSTFGQQVVLTATVSPNAATGTVQFLDGGTLLGAATLSGGSAVLPTSSLGAGSHSITVVYGGDAVYAGSTSAVLAEIVNKASTSVVAGSTANPSTFGQPVSFTAAITPASATGTVQFLDGSILLGTATLSGAPPRSPPPHLQEAAIRSRPFTAGMDRTSGALPRC